MAAPRAWTAFSPSSWALSTLAMAGRTPASTLFWKLPHLGTVWLHHCRYTDRECSFALEQQRMGSGELHAKAQGVGMHSRPTQAQGSPGCACSAGTTRSASSSSGELRAALLTICAAAHGGRANHKP